MTFKEVFLDTEMVVVRDSELLVYKYICTFVFLHVHMYVHTDVHVEWLRLVGSLKLQVSFAKETYKRDDILQKRPIILIPADCTDCWSR